MTEHEGIPKVPEESVAGDSVSLPHSSVSYADLSIIEHCRTCAFLCCMRGGSPAVSRADRDEIVRRSGRDYFKLINNRDSELFVIGFNPDGSKRQLSTDSCPYVSPDGTCSIHEFKPLDCLLYPLKPFYREPDDTEPTWTLDTRCPAARLLSKRFLEAARAVGRRFLEDLGRTSLSDYVREVNGWPLMSIAVEIGTPQANRPGDVRPVEPQCRETGQ